MYGFQAQFESDVASGRKPFTLRRARKPPARHASVGEPIGLWLGLRTPEARRFAVGLVVMRGLLCMSAAGITRMQGFVAHDRLETGPSSPALRKLTHALAMRDADALAQLDGFADYAACWAFHDAHRAESELEAPDLMRHLIAWKLIDPADAPGITDAERAEAETMH